MDKKARHVIEIIDEFLKLKQMQGKLDKFETRGVMAEIYQAYPEVFQAQPPTEE